MTLFFLLLLLVLAWEFPVVGLGLLAIGLIVFLVIGIIETKGAILLIIPAAGLVWLAYQGTYLWYSPNFWLAVSWITAIAAVVGVVAFLGWLHSKKPAFAIAIGVLLAVTACITLGIYVMFEEIEHSPIKSARELMREGYGNIELHLAVGDYETSGQRGDIKNALMDIENKRIMIVRTGTGAIVPENREVVTERLSGCVCLFLEGPGFRYVVHMTSSGALGYYYHRYGNADEMIKGNVARILEQLPPNIPKEQISATLIVNAPNEQANDTYGRPRLTKAWGKIQKGVLDVGIPNVRITELPLDETSVLFSPATPDVAHAIGTRTDIGEKGEYIFHPGEIVEQDIALGYSNLPKKGSS